MSEQRRAASVDAIALTIVQAADRLSISESSMRRLVDSGSIPSITVGGRLRRIPTVALDAYVARQSRARR
jgi:excisionase family DNA binding protein